MSTTRLVKEFECFVLQFSQRLVLHLRDHGKGGQEQEHHQFAIQFGKLRTRSSILRVGVCKRIQAWEMAVHNVATWSLLKCYMKWPPPAYLCNNVGANSALALRPNPGLRSFIIQQNPISRGLAPCSRQSVHVKACSSEVII